MPEQIDRPAMGKAVNEEPTVIGPHDLGFAASVVDAFKWIGQCLAGESIWVRNHRSNRHHPQVIEIEVQMWQQHASMAAATKRDAEMIGKPDLVDMRSA